MTRQSKLLSAIPAAFGALVVVLCMISVTVRVVDMPRVENGKPRTLDLDGGTYILYAEWDDTTGDDAVRCTVRDEGGTELKVSVPTYSASYSLIFREGRSVRDVFVPKPGKHTLSCEGLHGSLALGRNVGITVVIGFVSLILGILGSIILGFVLRKRTKG